MYEIEIVLILSMLFLYTCSIGFYSVTAIHGEIPKTVTWILSSTACVFVHTTFLHLEGHNVGISVTASISLLNSVNQFGDRSEYPDIIWLIVFPCVCKKGECLYKSFKPAVLVL